jgi:hypothetical protein
LARLCACDDAPRLFEVSAFVKKWSNVVRGGGSNKGFFEGAIH